MFPLQPTGFFAPAPLSTKPNANAPSLPSGGGSSVANLANAYDNDPTSFGDIFCPGTPTSYPTPSVQQTFVNFTHSPNTGVTANSFVTLNASLVVPWSVSSIVKGSLNYPNVYLQAFINGTFSDGTIAGDSHNTDNIVFADGGAAHTALSGGGSYSGLFSGNISRTIGPFSGKTIDVNSLTIRIMWSVDPGGTGLPDTGTVAGSFDCKVYDLTYIYS